MSPTCLWVSKFDVKLGVWVKIFKFTAGRWLFYFRFQKCHFLFLFVFSLGFQNLMFKRLVLSFCLETSLMGRVGRVGRSRKVSFNFLRTLWELRTCIYILVYKIKIVTNILMGFKFSCQVGYRGQKFQTHKKFVRTFLYI